MLIEQKKGLYLLFFVEMWERFSYYGMRALLVLYMIQELLFTTSKASNIYGIYTGLVYLTPLFGGYLADRYLGQRKCITIGTIFSSIGLLLLSTNIHKLFFISLILLILANGFFKSNISSLLGLLYEDDKDKKDGAFTIFYMGINLGALFSPLICGTLAFKYGFQYGFLSAEIGMLIGLITYKIFENKYLYNYGLTTNKNEVVEVEQKKLTKNEKHRILALFILMLFTIVFWTCYEQAGCSLTLFAEYATNRTFLNHTIPTGYFQSLNPLYILVLAPLMTMLWENLREKKKEPTSINKFTIALFLMSFAYIIMSIAGYLSSFNKVSMMWLVVVYLIMTLSELCISPIGLSLVSKLAPKQCISMLMGTWFLTSFFGNTFAGLLGGQYGTIKTQYLFLIFATISFISGVILTFLVKKLSKYLGRI